MRTYYDELEVAPTASPETIHAAFTSLTQRISNGGAPIDAARMDRLVTAYRVLSNPQQRADYDAGLNAGGATLDISGVAFGDNTRSYAPPAPPLSAIAGQSLDEFLAKPVVPLLIGSNLDKFRTCWAAAFAKHRTLRGVQQATTWSWPAFWCGPFYLCYRKMYFYAAAWAGAGFLISLLAYLAHSEAISGGFTALNVYVSMHAKGMYFQHVHSSAQKIEMTYPDNASQIAVATVRGGTSWAACIFGGLACLIVVSLPDFLGEAQSSNQSAVRPAAARHLAYAVATPKE